MDRCDGHGDRETRIRWAPRPDGLEESVQFMPGYNCPARGPESHGVHGMEIRWTLRGAAGAVCFEVFTNWIPGALSRGHGLSPAGEPIWRNPVRPGEMMYPSGVGIGYHARRPQYEGHEGGGHCFWIDGSCWADVQLNAAADLADRFRNSPRGEHVIWDELEKEYQRLHDGEEIAGIEAVSG